MSDGGKGSSPRPYSVDHETFANNWDLIFGKKSDVKDQPGRTENKPPADDNRPTQIDD